MTNDELQIWMLVAFIISLFFSFYKVYIMFNKPGLGIDTTTQKNELVDIISKALKGVDAKYYIASEVYEKIVNEDFDWKRHSNFNLNRFNQTINTLFIIHKVDTIEQLLEEL